MSNLEAISILLEHASGKNCSRLRGKKTENR